MSWAKAVSGRKGSRMNEAPDIDHTPATSGASKQWLIENNQKLIEHIEAMMGVLDSEYHRLRAVMAETPESAMNDYYNERANAVARVLIAACKDTGLSVPPGIVVWGE